MLQHLDFTLTLLVAAVEVTLLNSIHLTKLYILVCLSADIKKDNLKVESYVLFGGHSEDFSPGR